MFAINNKKPLVSMIVIAGVVALAGGAYLLLSNTKQLSTEPPETDTPLSSLSPSVAPAAVEPVEIEPTVEPSITSEPQVPMPAETQQEQIVKPVLPVLNESDGPFTASLDKLGQGSALLPLLASSEIIRKGVRAMHGLSEGFVVKEYRPVTSPVGQFKAADTGKINANDERLYRLSTENFSRYQSHLKALTGLSPAAVAELYRQYYPLMQQAYEELGLRDGNFRQITDKAIRNVLDAELVFSAHQLRRPSVMFIYDEKAIESQTAVHKLLLRMGEENSAELKQWLNEFKDALAE